MGLDRILVSFSAVKDRRDAAPFYPKKSAGRWCFDSHADGSYLLIPELTQIDLIRPRPRIPTMISNPPQLSRLRSCNFMWKKSLTDLVLDYETGF
jgi:hypothetical protein